MGSEACAILTVPTMMLNSLCAASFLHSLRNGQKLKKAADDMDAVYGELTTIKAQGEAGGFDDQCLGTSS